MVNCDGLLVSDFGNIGVDNRSFLYGDGVFETFRIHGNKILFFEDHYFRLMASMRIVRMEIPMKFTMEFLEEQILTTVKANDFSESARVRLTVYRNSGGHYLPTNNNVSFVIQVGRLDHEQYSISGLSYEVDLYRDYYVSKHLLSTLKTTSKIINVVGSIYAKENGLQNCLLLNEEKNVVEAMQGNIFMLMGTTLITPPLSDGCLNGVMRKNLLRISRSMEGLEVREESISPFDLQKADELFITNVVQGIQPITRYRKKEYGYSFAEELVQHLNTSISSI